MMAEGKIIDVAVKKTSHSIHLPKQSHQTKSREFPEYLRKITDLSQVTDKLSHNVVSSTPRLRGARTHNVIVDMH